MSLNSVFEGAMIAGNGRGGHGVITKLKKTRASAINAQGASGLINNRSGKTSGNYRYTALKRINPRCALSNRIAVLLTFLLGAIFLFNELLIQDTSDYSCKMTASSQPQQALRHDSGAGG